MANKEELGPILRDEALKKKQEANAIKNGLANGSVKDSAKLAKKTQEEANREAKAAQDRYDKWKKQMGK